MTYSTNDRRKHKRYEVQDTFATLNPNLIIGPVIDLSLGGVSFSCMESENLKYKKTVLELYSKSPGSNLGKIPFGIVSETKVKDQSTFSTVQMKRIGGCFLELTEPQKLQLDRYIQRFSTNAR